MSDTGEVIFEKTSRDVRDSDGDGVSDVQERLDGTDPNDAADGLHVLDPQLDPTVIGAPGTGPGSVILERETVVDVTVGLPDGKSIEQGLPKGLDGKDLPTGPNHYGNADADKMFSGHSGEGSPLDMQRDPTSGGIPGPSTGHDPTKDTLGRSPGPGSGGATFSDRASADDLPPEMLNTYGTATQTNETVSQGKLPPLKQFVWEPRETPFEQNKRETTLPDYDEQLKAAEAAKFTRAPKAGSGFDNLGEIGSRKKKEYDTGEGDGGVGAPSAEDIERAIAVKGGGATDFVEGYGGGPQIDTSQPPEGKYDHIINKGDGGTDTFDTGGTMPAVPPGAEISHTINPDLGPTTLPRSVPPNTGEGDPGVDGQNGLQSDSDAATAASSPSPSGGLSAVGDGDSGGGISTVAVEDVVPPTDAAPAALEVAPVEVAPVEVAPVEVAPVEVAPVEVAPVEVAPVEVAEVMIDPIAAEMPIAETIDPLPAPSDFDGPADGGLAPAEGDLFDGD